MVMVFADNNWRNCIIGIFYLPLSVWEWGCGDDIFLFYMCISQWFEDDVYGGMKGLFYWNILLFVICGWGGWVVVVLILFYIFL